MAYIGNQVTSVPHIVDVYSGDAVTTSFGPLTRAPAGTAAIAVFVSGSYKTPGIDYTLSGDYINFTVAPASGGDNVVIHHLGNGTTTQVPSDGSVTGNKLASDSIRANNIVAGQITGNLLASNVINSNNIVNGAILGNNIVGNAIRANNIVAGQITGNLIGTGAISGNLIGTGAISGNQIGVGAVSGNQIGTGAISANNFAGGGITSNVLASNLSISLTRASESANLNAIGIGGNVNIDVVDNAVFYFNANTTANITFNLRANTQNTFDSITSVGQSVTVAMIVKHGTTRHTANLYIDGGLILTGATPFAGGTTANALFYAGNTAPNFQSITNAEVNTFGYTILKMAANSYHVIASNTLCKLG